MPELTWVGKAKVVTHHLDVPFRVLNRQYSFDESGQHEGDNGSPNMIIHGDNLEALKALLPQYEGLIDCIYIDPPYNTGNESWIYNDNVNDPQIKKWLGDVVGKEGEDLSRHDKWLSMMYPRLRLLHKLLSPTGVIFISIDDNEFANLGQIMNEIFGASNRLAYAPVRSEPSGGKDKTALRTGHEYLLVYTKGDQSALAREEKATGLLDLNDTIGPYKKGRELRKWGATSDRSDRLTLWFPITAPNGTQVLPFKNDGTEGYWRWSTAHSGMARLLEDPDFAHWELAPYDSGVSVNGQFERWVPYEKVRDVTRAFGWNTWLDGYGTNADATSVIKAIFGSKKFDTPKPVSLIEWVVALTSNPNAIVLDSFAGSATTAHAVLNMNKKDGGNRSFILVELGDYAETVTAERVRRVIDGFSGESTEVAILFEQKLTLANLEKAPEILSAAAKVADDAKGKYIKVSRPRVVTKVTGKRGQPFVQVVATQTHDHEVPGTGGSFSFYEVGEPLLVDGILNTAVPVDQVREYIWFTETQTPLPPSGVEKHPFYMGTHRDTVYHFIYEPDKTTNLGRKYVTSLTPSVTSDALVIYADTCTLSSQELSALNITFKKIPRDITRL
ncbi:site-specific DNA-methyltransferase [Salinibacterium sp. M195]|uniref:site-specific DNA-methyltransferase n=1 Tax=Salinibacterium sp. M195 TaxID=2583374 RepID=UPI001C63A981|nr:site-specific DNA-methyltransferase [Salinibacterium sp. M195]QYH36391.1 site-specific DNA-methyltransferase [Salinibacterium sp. M195]